MGSALQVGQDERLQDVPQPEAPQATLPSAMMSPEPALGLADTWPASVTPPG